MTSPTHTSSEDFDTVEEIERGGPAPTGTAPLPRLAPSVAHLQAGTGSVAELSVGIQNLGPPASE